MTPSADVKTSVWASQRYHSASYRPRKAEAIIRPTIPAFAGFRVIDKSLLAIFRHQGIGGPFGVLGHSSSGDIPHFSLGLFLIPTFRQKLSALHPRHSYNPPLSVPWWRCCSRLKRKFRLGPLGLARDGMVGQYGIRSSDRHCGRVVFPALFGGLVSSPFSPAPQLRSYSMGGAGTGDCGFPRQTDAS